MRDSMADRSINLKRAAGSLRDISRLIWLGQIYFYLKTQKFIQNPLIKKEIFNKEEQEKIRDALNFFLMLRNEAYWIGIKEDVIDEATQQKLVQHLSWLKDTDSLYKQYLEHTKAIITIKEKLKQQVLNLLPIKVHNGLRRIYNTNTDTFIEGLSDQDYLSLARQSLLLKYLVALNCKKPDVLRKLYKRAKWSIRYALGRNENTPVEILEAISKNTTYEERDVRLMLARNKKIPYRILTKLLHDNAEVVRVTAAKNLEDRLIAEMSKEEKMLMLLWPNTPKSINLPEHRRIKKKFGVDLFQICEREMQSLNDIVKHMNSIIRKFNLPLLFTINQEGGRLNELNMYHTVTPSNMALGAISDLNEAIELTYKAASIIAKELRASGITWNFAPVADLLYKYENRDVGTRSFGSNSKRTAVLVAAFIKGLQDNGVMATIKHFPTYGKVEKDAHVGLCRINSSDEDLEPYREAIKVGVASIMLGHVIVEDWDRDNPVSVSPEAIRIIRQNLNYEGLIVTDGLTMRALEEHYRNQGKDPIEAAIDAFRAGVDIMLFVQDFTHRRIKKEQMKANEEKMHIYLRLREYVRTNADKFSEERINVSFRRLIMAMIRYGITEPLNRKDIYKIIKTPESKEIMELIGERSVTLIKNDGFILPLKPKSKDKLLVISIKPPMSALTDKTWYTDFSIYNAIKEYCKNTVNLPVDLTFDEVTKRKPNIQKLVKEVLQKSRNYNIIIIQTYNAYLPDILEGKKNQAEIVRVLLREFNKKKKIIVVATGAPYDIIEFPDAPVYISTYSPSDASLSAAAKLIFGQIEPSGCLPVEILGLYPRGYGLSYWNYENLREKYIRRYQLDSEIYSIPQEYGSHAEGPILDNHLQMMLKRLKNLIAGKDSNVPEEWVRIANQYQELLKDFIFLHDIGKYKAIRIKVDNRDISKEEYERIPKEVKEDPERTKITYKGHEEISYKILKDKISEELAEIIRIHGINDIFRKKIDDIESIRRGYEQMYRIFKGDNTLLNLAFIAMYIDAAASLKVRYKGQKPTSEEKKLYESFCKARDEFRHYFPLEALEDKFPEKPGRNQLFELKDLLSEPNLISVF